MFIACNAAGRVLVSMLIAYKLIRFHDMLNPAERFGLGICGGTVFLTIPVVFASGNYRTPFDDWASMLFTFGFLIYLASRTTRHVRHQRNNDLAAKAARLHAERRSRP
jgi:hypothetical protein